MQKRLVRTALLCVLGLLAGAGIAWTQLQSGPAAVVQQTAPQSMAGADIGGPFTLVNQDGQTVTDQDFAGRWKLVYFGFTYCPAICPTELQKMAKALNAMGPAGDAIQPIFITTDPDRDTPEAMKKFVELFHPRLIGLTGDRKQIKDVQKNYRVYAKKVQTQDKTEYTMDHSSFIYLMSPQGELVAIYRGADTAEKITSDLKARLGA